MLVGLAIRDVVLIEALDLSPGGGLTVLTGETGAGKSIVLDALGLATGARADAGLVRPGAAQAGATAIFSLPPGHPAFALLGEKGLDADPAEDLVLRRQLSSDGRSRAFVNDQAVGVGVLRELGDLLVEVHGQHETVGLLDPRTHRALLDAYGGAGAAAQACAGAWNAWRSAAERTRDLAARAARGAADADEMAARLAELDRLDPREGEETALAEQRALLGAAEKALGEIASARDTLGGDALTGKMAASLRALERARERTLKGGASADSAAPQRLAEAAEALDRALVEAHEALAAVDAAVEAFTFRPDELEKAEERLFALRAAARKLGVAPDELPAARLRLAEALRAEETLDEELADARGAEEAARVHYKEAAAALTAARKTAGAGLARAVQAELAPLKLDKARFQVAVEPLPLERQGAHGVDRVVFEIATNPGAPFGPLESIASGGELARFALALKASLAARDGAGAGVSLLIFDEVDQGVGGAVADAVGLRLRRLAESAQVLVVTHSPQVAARGDVHWRVSKATGVTRVEPLSSADREEEIARMLAGSEITEAARAAARALMDA